MTPLPPYRPAPSRAALGATAAALVAAAAAVLLTACGDQPDSVAGFAPDRQAPAVRFDSAAAPAADSAVAFTVTVTDNLDLSRVHVDVTGGVEATVDTVIRATTPRLALPLRFAVPAGVAPGTPVKVVARARDGAGNEAVSDTLRLSVGNLRPPTVALTSPAPASLFVTGKRTTLTLAASSPLKVCAVGYRVSGPFARVDSVAYGPAAQRDSVVLVDTLEVPADAPAGVLRVRPFVWDCAGRPAADTASVSFAVQGVGATSTVPVPAAGFGPRLEAGDTVRVSASDPVGVRSYGYEVLLRDDTTRRLGADSVVLADAALVNDARRFTLRLRPDTLPGAAGGRDSLPLRVFVRAFATNGAGRRFATPLAAGAGAAAADTALVVAGATTPLPNGGRLADGLYAPRFDRLYLTNIDRNALEVFDVGGRRFLGAVSVGSRPWGIAPWPAGRDGAFGDTLFVANSGGTNVSYVDLTQGSGREVYRYALPNIIAYSVTTERMANGSLVPKRRVYDFSDRPQYLATTCGGDLAAGRCDEPILVYSTTPTPGQSLPFPGMGTVRWENLKRHSSHLFFEQAADRTSEESVDTLEVERFAAGGVGSDSVLVPAVQTATDPVTGATRPFSVEVEVKKLAFRDTTYVRNSGNFARAVVGEGGPVLGSRALMYDATRGLEPTATKGLAASRWRLERPVYDRGVSRAGDVSDFIANSFARVMGVAINFDGALAAVRGDSTYLIDPTLRLQGLLHTSGGSNAGFDFHPLNAGPRAPAAARFAFSASQLPQIEVYDTWCYQRVRTIPVREPIVGPVRATRRRSGEVVLVGASARGVIVVSVPEPIASSCQ
jgi:hypothetical protein